MRHFVLVAAVFAVAGLVWSAGGRADDQKKNQSQGDRDKQGQSHIDAAKFIKHHDKNNDGVLTKDELPANMQKAFDRIDANKDGKITADEMKQHATRMSRGIPVEVVSIWVVEAEDAPSRQDLQEAYDTLRELDANHDGQISQDEVKAGHQKAMKRRLDSMVKQCDANSDGKLSRDECRGWLRENFSEVDKNGDGFVTKQEIQDWSKGQSHHASAANSTPSKK